MRLALAYLTLAVAPAIQTFDFSSLQYSPVLLMARQDVRKEMKLSKEQSKLADKVMKDIQTAGRDSQKDPMASMKAINKGNEDILVLLDEVQKQRLTEIRWQAMGVNCVLDPSMKELLQLTDEQSEAVQTSKSGLMTAWLEQARSGKMDSKKLEKIGKEHEEKVLALLTEEQRTTYKLKLGKPFPNARPKGSPPF